MPQFTEGLFDTEAVTRTMRAKSAAILGGAAALTRLHAASGRMQEYASAAAAAHELGHHAEARALSLAISTAAADAMSAAAAFGSAIDREMAVQERAA